MIKWVEFFKVKEFVITTLKANDKTIIVWS